MTARRLLATAGRLSVVGLAALALTGCEKPAPIVTVVSGASSEWKEADVYCFEGQSGDQCAERSEEATRVPATAGERIGVDVDKDVVERGWYWEISLGEQTQRSEVQRDKHYSSLFMPNVGDETLRLTVVALGDQGEQGPPSGQWVFELVPE